jgi:hypothetical protein
VRQRGVHRTVVRRHPIVIPEGTGRIFPTLVTARAVANWTSLVYRFTSSRTFRL